jgi:hypothetical protein
MRVEFNTTSSIIMESEHFESNHHIILIGIILKIFHISEKFRNSSIVYTQNSHWTQAELKQKGKGKGKGKRKWKRKRQGKFKQQGMGKQRQK